MSEKKTAPQDRGAEQRSCFSYKEEKKTHIRTFGFSGSAYNQVIVFQNEEDFRMALSANPKMEAIMGDRQKDKEHFPDVYIAGIRANSQTDKSAGHHVATQK